MSISTVRRLATPLDHDALEHLRTQLLRRIAHDIASPAGVTMTVLAELVSSKEPRPDLVAMAQRSVRRLMRLSDQLAMVAELEAASLEPELASADLRVLAKQAFEDALAIDGRKDVTPTCELPDEPLPLACDVRLLSAVLREIASNALKLASGAVRVTVGTDDDRAFVCIEDDGPGFSAEALATLGQRFVPRASRGLGLSLSMAMEVVRAHGGALTVDASSLPPGRRGTTGAAVTLTIPRVESAASAG